VTGSGTVLLVRHGRTEANARGLLLGRRDVALDAVGRDQARALAAAVEATGGPPDVVISSPLARARQTAAAFGPAVEVRDDERWLELDYGQWDGRPAGDVAPEDWVTWRSDPDFTPPDGESLATLTARVHPALDELAATADGRRIVVVTHVSPIKAGLAWALGQGPEVAWRSFVAPASITRVRVGPGGPVLEAFNETAHLAET
jgi:probable phosphoglycerate mutase